MELCLSPARNESRSFHYIGARPYRRNSIPTGAQNKFFFLETSGHKTPNELIGTLMINEHDYQSSPAVVKVACEERDRRRLFNEYRHLIYFSTRKNVMVQKVYGLFTMIKGGVKQTILLLEYVGEPVLHLNRLTLYQEYVMFQLLCSCLY